MHLKDFSGLRKSENAAQSPPALFLLYLSFSDPADETATAPATSHAEIHARLQNAAADSPRVTQSGLSLIT